MTTRDAEANQKHIVARQHALQTGIGLLAERDPSRFSVKHQRVGIDSLFANVAAMARLLVDKGLITWDEYWQYQADEMDREVERKEAELEQMLGTEVRLA